MSDDTDAVSGATQLGDLLGAAERGGFEIEFRVADDPTPVSHVHCTACGVDSEASAFERVWSRRLEGASDPSDMLHVSGLICPNCRARGVFISPFGPNASARESAVLRQLPDSEHAEWRVR